MRMSSVLAATRRNVAGGLLALGLLAVVPATVAPARADEPLRILDMVAAARAWERFILLAIPDPRERIGLL